MTEQTELTGQTPPSFDDRLHSIWHQGGRDIAMSFLRRVVQMDMSLADLAKALEFGPIPAHLSSIRLVDVMSRQPIQVSAKADAGVPVSVGAVRAPKKTRRARRGPEAMQAIKEAIVSRLQASVGGASTPHLTDVLMKGGHEVDLSVVTRLLGVLETEGSIQCVGGRPKVWRMRPQGRLTPEPPLIRKAAQQSQIDLASG